jgi:IgA Peptidase M64
VGIWEGAHTFAKGVYRPEIDCHMRTLTKPFCRVCEKKIRERLAIRCHDLSDFLTCDPPCGKFRWAFPPGCLSCSDFRLEDEITFIVEGPSEEYTLEVLNDHAEVIAQGVHTEQGLTVEFRARRSDQYYFELNGPGHEQKTLTFRANLLRNGKQENLPGAVVR